MIKVYGEAELPATVTSSLWEQQPAPTGFVAGWASKLVWLFGEEKNPNHTSLNENYVVPCICLRAI